MARTTKRAAKTAAGPMTIAAAERYLPRERRVVDDELAYRFLPTADRLMVGLGRWRPIRNFFVNMTESLGTGLYASFLCRKRYIDDVVAGALRKGVDAVVILGAGFDTRGYRLAFPTGTALYEVDLPENIALKRDRVRKVYGEVPEHATLVPVDFDTDDLGDVLRRHGYDPAGRTCFVLEAVTQYLTEEGLRSTFEFFATAVPDSELVFTYVLKSFIDGTDLLQADRLYQMVRVKEQLFRYGFDPDAVPGFLETYGWRQIEQVGPAEYLKRYVEPSGRVMPVTAGERAVHAVRTGDRNA